MFESLKAALFRACGNYCIKRATRTPYFHLYHQDGTPYMERYWLIRLGMPMGWREREVQLRLLEQSIRDGMVSPQRRTEVEKRISELLAGLYPRVGIRIHRIMSSDIPVFHDHPWDYTTLILRGGYTEVTPAWSDVFTPGIVTPSNDYDGHRPQLPLHINATWYGAGSILRRKARSWHYLTLRRKDDETWSLFITGKKLQGWGFLVDGLVKVPWQIYEARQREQASAQRACV